MARELASILHYILKKANFRGEEEMMEQNLYKGEKGVTLIELVIVMAIIAIMGLFMTPSIGDWVQNYRIKQAARNLSSDLQSAKMQAISIHKYCTVAFNVTVDGTQYSYVIFPDYNNNMQLDTGIETTGIYKKTQFSTEYKTVTFDTSQPGNGITFNGNVMAFDSRGLPRNNTGGFAGGTVCLINTKNNIGRSITVSAAGALSIVEYQ
jgi:prepilin-type N-terminal cleavage/methylation domain-containing protein